VCPGGWEEVHVGSGGEEVWSEAQVEVRRRWSEVIVAAWRQPGVSICGSKVITGSFCGGIPVHAWASACAYRRCLCAGRGAGWLQSTAGRVMPGCCGSITTAAASRQVREARGRMCL
jgi:hypothetical protein